MNRKRALSAVAVPLLFTLLVPFTASATLSHPSGGHVKFTATGPGGLHIVGESKAVEVKDDGKQIAVAVPLAGLDTGIGLRDQHMKEKYLEVGHYPKAELTVARDQLRFPDAGSKVSAEARGKMKIHGRAKPVSFHYTARSVARGYDVDGKVRLKIPDYGINVPSYLGVTVKPDVDVEVHFHVDGN